MPTLRIIDDGDPDDNTEPIQAASTSTDQVLCNICQKQFSNYVCPRCNLRYCSLACYKDLQHAECTESFYKESITAEIQSRGGVDHAEKREMLELLRRFEAENDDAAFNEDEDEDDLAERLATLDIETAEPTEIWARLSEQERKAFEQLLQNRDRMDDLLNEYEPWWWAHQEMAPRIQELGEDEDGSDTRGLLPQLPDPLPKIESMVKTIHPDLAWHLTSVLMSYCYMMRHFMGEVREDIESTITCLQETSVLFTPKAQLSTMEDVLVDLMRRLGDENEAPTNDLMVLLLDDVIQLSSSTMYVVRAMADVDALLRDGIKHYGKDQKAAKHKVFLAEKKAYFYLAYAAHLAQHEELRLLPIVLSIKAERERMAMDRRVFQAGEQAAKAALHQRQRKHKISETET